MYNSISEISLSYKPSAQSRNMNPIQSSKDAYRILKDLFNPDLICAREEFIVVYLNNSGRVLGHFKAFTGGVASVTCDMKIILGVGLKSLASSIILSHNHPSGNLKPSKNDLNMTKRILKACQVLDIQLFDHIVISEAGYFSFADEGLLVDEE